MKEIFGKNVVLFDGGMGTMIQKHKDLQYLCPEVLNITNPQIIEEIHREYVKAGSDIITTNTFGASNLKLKEFHLEDKLEEIICQGVEIARSAAGKMTKIALDIGPTGWMFEPYGQLDFEMAYETFKKIALLGKKAGADLIIIETMSNLGEARAALLASVETDLPVICQMTFEKNNKTLFGTDAITAAIVLESMGAFAIGANCSGGPDELYGVIEDMGKYTSIPLIVQPNAGIPEFVDNKTIFPLKPTEMAEKMKRFLELGVFAIGGCCGTTPEHIAQMKKLLPYSVKGREYKDFSAATSSTKTVFFGTEFPASAAGEKINPTGKPLLTEAIKEGNWEYIIKEGREQEEAGAVILDVNVNIAGSDEKEILPTVVNQLQKHLTVPLMLDSRDTEALEKALRIYNGKAIINSVDGNDKILDEVLPLAKKYGSSVVALCMEKGIPKTAEDRLKVAKKIRSVANRYGIKDKDIIYDGLTLTIGSGKYSAMETLKTIKEIKKELGSPTILGISNISHGLPEREEINRDFLSMALSHGLDMAIIDVTSTTVMAGFRASNYLTGRDKEGREFFARKIKDEGLNKGLYGAIFHGLKENAATESKKELAKGLKGEEIINNHIVKALEDLGKKYENGEIFLPQLLMGAEASKVAIDTIFVKEEQKKFKNQNPIILATVEGDIHDIGKNILNILLSNWGFKVIDLGKDVPWERIVKTALEAKSTLIGLSSLMTTTLPAMEKTIKEIRKSLPNCKVMVGGAVLNQKLANDIGADFYGKDAREGVKIAQSLLTEEGKNGIG